MISSQFVVQVARRFGGIVSGDRLAAACWLLRRSGGGVTFYNQQGDQDNDSLLSSD
jgi:hypothetical protein